MKCTYLLRRTAHTVQTLRDRLLQTRAFLAWKSSQNKLNDLQQRIVSDLDRDGIAINVSELGLDAQFQELCEHSSLLKPLPKKTGGIMKPFLHKLLSENVVDHDPESIYGRVCLDSRLLEIASAYFRGLCSLSEYNMWLNVPIDDSAQSSQLWHRDPGDICLLKMFGLVTDLTPSNGSFHYLRGSHWRGPHARLTAPSTHDGFSSRSNDEQMRQLTDERDWIHVTGPRGTIIFADTRGYHKGGLVQSDHRLLLAAMYTRWMYTGESMLRQTTPLADDASVDQEWALRAIRRGEE